MVMRDFSLWMHDMHRHFSWERGNGVRGEDCPLESFVCVRE